MNDITVVTEFINCRQLLESATRLIQGALDGMEDTESRQFEALQIALRYLFKLDEILTKK